MCEKCELVRQMNEIKEKAYDNLCIIYESIIDGVSEKILAEIKGIAREDSQDKIITKYTKYFRKNLMHDLLDGVDLLDIKCESKQ